jgi:hypothetical protein
MHDDEPGNGLVIVVALEKPGDYVISYVIRP